MSRKTQSGITIHEALVLVVVMAVIAAILFPVFATVRQGRSQSLCHSNEKQLGIALQEYAQDNDGYFCSGTQPTIVNAFSLAYSK